MSKSMTLQDKAMSKVEFCTVFITCKKSGDWLCFVFHHPEKSKEIKTYVEG